MSTLFDIARHPFAAFTSNRGEGRSSEAPLAACDPYEGQRLLRLAQLEADGKCLARSGKHGNLRYWPSECGSRVLSEHRRRQRPRAA